MVDSVLRLPRPEKLLVQVVRAVLEGPLVHQALQVVVDWQLRHQLHEHLRALNLNFAYVWGLLPLEFAQSGNGLLLSFKKGVEAWRLEFISISGSDGLVGFEKHSPVRLDRKGYTHTGTEGNLVASWSLADASRSW